jgi:uncharacterized membrane-anchored protein YjiN (DUF445 family)
MILPANEARIGEGLARFLDRHFLAPELLLPELHSLHIANKIASWLARRRNAQALAGKIAKVMPHLLRAVDDRQIGLLGAAGSGCNLRSVLFGFLAPEDA